MHQRSGFTGSLLDEGVCYWHREHIQVRVDMLYNARDDNVTVCVCVWKPASSVSPLAWIIRKCLNTCAHSVTICGLTYWHNTQNHKKKKEVHQHILSSLSSSLLCFALFLLRCLISWESLEPRKKAPWRPCVCVFPRGLKSWSLAEEEAEEEKKNKAMTQSSRRPAAWVISSIWKKNLAT